MTSKFKLHQQIIGAGPDLVCLHGWGMHSQLFQPLVARLQQHYRITLIDLPGCGGSREVSIPYQLDALCQALDDIISKPCMLLGWSLGGLIARHYAVNTPDAVNQLITIASNPCFVADSGWPGIDRQILNQFATQLQDNPEQTLAHFFQLQCYGLTDAKAALSAIKASWQETSTPTLAALAGGLQLLANTDQRSQLLQVQQPTLMLYGSHDRIVPASVEAAITQMNIDNLTQRVIDKATHMPFFTHTDACVVQLQQWQTSLESTV